MYNKMSILKYISNVKIFIKHLTNPEVLRLMYKKKGNNFEVFGGEAKCTYEENVVLMQDQNII